MLKDPKIVPGFEIPELVKHPTLRQLVRYAGAAGDFYEIHYDPEAARANGLPGVILHGLLKTGFLAELVTTWAGSAGRLSEFQVSYRGIDLPDRPLRCRGVVASVTGTNVTLTIWTEDPEGNHTTIGHAVVLFEDELSSS